jgi:hypothetical protein
VEEQPGHQLHHHQHPAQLGAEAGHQQQHEGGGQHGGVDGVEPEAADPVELLGRVVDAVEPPQERHLVAEPVAPVADHVEQQDAQHRPGRRRQGQHDRAEQQAGQPQQRHRAEHEAHADADGAQRSRGQGVGQVGAEGPAAHRLAVAGEQLLERHHQHEHEQHRADGLGVDGQGHEDGERHGHPPDPAPPPGALTGRRPGRRWCRD